MKTHVVVGTTEGPVMIQRITAEESGVQSVICLDGTVQSLPVSAAYHGFVRRGTGVIARDFGHDAFRVDVNGRIDQGVSWQLPVYLAHALHSQHVLGDGRPQPGDRVLWATGEVDVDLCVRAVAGVAEKLTRSLELIQRWRAQGIEVQVLLPSPNLGEGAGQIEALAGVNGVSNLPDAMKPWADGTRMRFKSAWGFLPSRRQIHWGAAILVVGLLLLAGLEWRQSVVAMEPVPAGLDLDDFGERSRPTDR